MGLSIPLAARKDTRPASGGEKKKNLSEGFRQSTVTPPANPNLPLGHPKTKESSFSADCFLGFEGGTRAGCGIRSVLNPVERIAGLGRHRGGAACAEARVCEPRVQVVFPPRGCCFVSGVRAASVVASCEERPGGPERTALLLVLPSFSLLQGVKSQRNIQRPPGTAKTCPQR